MKDLPSSLQDSKKTIKQEDNIQFSASKIKTAAMCPRAFLLANHYKRRPFQFQGAGIGKFVHSCLQFTLNELNKYTEEIKGFLATSKVKQLESFVQEMIYKSYFVQLPTLMQKSTRLDFLEHSWATLQKFILFLSDFLHDIYSQQADIELDKLFLKQEWSFKATLTNDNGRKVSLRGRIDVLAFNPIRKKLLLWDFKTYNTKNLDIDILQLATYYRGVKEKIGIKPWLCLLYCTDKEIRVEEFSAKQMESFQPQFENFVFRMLEWVLAESLPPRAMNSTYCEICSLSKECRFHYPTKDTTPLIKAYF